MIIFLHLKKKNTFTAVARLFESRNAISYAPHNAMAPAAVTAAVAVTPAVTAAAAVADKLNSSI